MKSSLKNMVLALLLITLASASLLGYVYNITKEPIEEAKRNKTVATFAKVIEEFDNNPTEDSVHLTIDNLPVIVYKGSLKGTVSGYAVESITRQGFSGEIKLMTGFDTNGDIYNIEVLEQKETPGLGSKMEEPGNVLLVSFQGKNPADLNMKVTKDGGDIDCITASTISSRAYVDAVERAYKAFLLITEGSLAEDTTDYFAEVLPEYDNDILQTEKIVDVNGKQIPVYTATQANKIIGYAVKSSSDNGYHGTIEILTGFTTELKINNVAVTQQSETIGIGDVIVKPDNAILASLKGNDLSNIKLSLRSSGGDVDAISNSTISSEAYVEAIREAYEAIKKYREEEGNE